MNEKKSNQNQKSKMKKERKKLPKYFYLRDFRSCRLWRWSYQKEKKLTFFAVLLIFVKVFLNGKCKDLLLLLYYIDFKWKQL